MEGKRYVLVVQPTERCRSKADGERDLRLTPFARLVYSYLVWRRSKEKQTRIAHIGEWLGLHRNTVTRCLKRLCRMGLIEKTRRLATALEPVDRDWFLWRKEKEHEQQRPWFRAFDCIKVYLPVQDSPLTLRDHLLLGKLEKRSRKKSRPGVADTLTIDYLASVMGMSSKTIEVSIERLKSAELIESVKSVAPGYLAFRIETPDHFAAYLADWDYLPKPKKALQESMSDDIIIDDNNTQTTEPQITKESQNVNRSRSRDDGACSFERQALLQSGADSKAIEQQRAEFQAEYRRRRFPETVGQHIASGIGKPTYPTLSDCLWYLEIAEDVDHLCRNICEHIDLMREESEKNQGNQ